MTLLMDRDDRIRVYMAGGITGGLMNTPVDMTVENLPDDVFERIRDIVRLLSSPVRKLSAEELNVLSEEEDWVGDYGYFVEVGNHGDPSSELKMAFAGSFVKQPVIVKKLYEMLEKHASPEDRQLKL